MMTPKRIGLVGFDRVTALHLVGTAEAFAAAALDDGYGGRIPCYSVTIVGVGSDRFQAESGVALTGTADLQNAPEFDTIIIAGGSGIQAPGVSDAIAAWLLRRIATTERFGAVCTGVYGLAPTGLLDGHEVTVHWRAASDLARRYPGLQVNHKKPLVHGRRLLHFQWSQRRHQSLARDDQQRLRTACGAGRRARSRAVSRRRRTAGCRHGARAGYVSDGPVCRLSQLDRS